MLSGTLTDTTSKIALLALPAIASVALGLGGCDKPTETTTPETPAAPDTPEAPDAEAPAADAETADAEEKTWADMSFDEKKKFMGAEYYPAMKKEFQAHDGEEFAEFTCASCHGDDAKEVGFELPNDLTPLSTDDPIQAGKDMDEEITKFMMETVVPKTAEMMDRPTWSPETPEGVGCFTCHMQG